MKRSLDFIIALASIILFSPILLLISFLILISDGMPIFFSQSRVGKDGQIFRLIKFRSMRVLKGSENGSFDAGNTSRITGIGRILRKTKLDELPQLFNVLLGNMSIVGPRPEVEQWTKAYPERWKKVLKVKPGITDNASIEFRNEEELLAAATDPEQCYRNEILPRKLDLYEAYVDNRSVFKDLSIVLRTVFVVVFK